MTPLETATTGGMHRWQSDGSGAAVKSISEWLAENQPPELESVPKAPVEAAPPNKTINSDYAEAFPFDDMQSSPHGHDFSGLIRPAHEYADAWDKMYEEATNELQRWIDQEPGAWPLAAAMQTAMDLGKLDVDALRLGKGMAEGDALGIVEDGLRATGIATQVVSAVKLLDPNIFKPYWKYYAYDPQTGKRTLPIVDENDILRDNVYLARGKRKPYSYAEAKDKLQIPMEVVYDAKKVKVPWYRPVRGPRRSFNQELYDQGFGEGGGLEYLTGPSWDKAKNLEFTKFRERMRNMFSRSHGVDPDL